MLESKEGLPPTACLILGAGLKKPSPWILPADILFQGAENIVVIRMRIVWNKNEIISNLTALYGFEGNKARFILTVLMFWI